MLTVLITLLELDLANALAEVLRHLGFQTVVASTPEQGVRLAEQMRLGLLVTGVNLPRIAGRSLCEWIRAQPHHEAIPAIVLTSVPLADDPPSRHATYVLKPFDVALVISHVQRLLGNPELQQETVMSVGPLTVDIQTFQVRGPGGSAALTATEFRLLRFLLRHQGAPVHPSQLLQEHWGSYGVGGLALVRVHIRNLRSKLRTASGGETPELIKTIPGRGYVFAPPG